MNEIRINKIINDSIQKLELSLQDLTVLTEIGSGYYGYLPLIAKIAKANEVIAFSKDSRYGTAKENIKCLKAIFKKLNIDYNNVTFVDNEILDEHVGMADIITNSGMLRPLNKAFLSKTKKGVVIPLMFEKWEFRDEDIDIDYCLKNRIEVYTLNEYNTLLYVVFAK